MGLVFSEPSNFQTFLKEGQDIDDIWITEELRNYWVVIIAVWISLLKEYKNVFTVLKPF